MNNIKLVQVENQSGDLETHVMIDRGNGEFTSMPKSVWDELEAAKEAQSL